MKQGFKHKSESKERIQSESKKGIEKNEYSY